MEKELFDWIDVDQCDTQLWVFLGVTRKSDGKFFQFANLDLENGFLEYGNDAGVCERYSLELRIMEQLL